MKAILCLSFCVLLTAAVKIQPDTVEREIIADTLRDHPGFCFASTLCRTFKVGEKWDLQPYCGFSECIEGKDRLMEVVRDCGLPPLSIEGCTVERNGTLPFPQCCPIYDCEEGVKLEFPKFPPIPPSA